MTTVDPSDRPTQAPAPVGEWEESADLPMAEVRDLFVTLTKAVRAHQLYDENNPVYQRFVSALRGAFRRVWDEMDQLAVAVEEDRLAWMGEDVYRASSRSDSLSFLFFKDGIRELTFLKGIEGPELEGFLNVLRTARLVRGEGDDVLTILWEADLEFLQYQYIDLLAEGLELPGPTGEPLPDLSQVLAEEVGSPEEAEDDGESGEGGEASPVTVREDFNPTLYALEPAEMDALQVELAAELRRDLRGDVLHGLFDRLEEREAPERQSEILGILHTLLPNLLSRGALSVAAELVATVTELRKKEGVLDERRQQEADGVLREVSSPAALGELVQALEDGSIRPEGEALRSFLEMLHPRALAPLLGLSERAGERGVGPILREAAQGIGSRNPAALIQLLVSDEPVVARGAARLAGSLKLEEAGPGIARLMSHPESDVRRVAVEAARDLASASVTGALQSALEDDVSEVRAAAARAIGSLRFTPAASRLKDAIGSRAMREADLSEKIAFFEAYGQVGDPEAVRLLDRLLNGRGFLGRKELPEIRACAALALGKVGSVEAVEVLEKALDEVDPVIRSAVNRALRPEEAS
jgi:hypothetical protein